MPTLNHPLWLEGAGTAFPSLDGDLLVDVAVVGAGITGATTALLLKQAGVSVALLDSGRVCSGATGYTTAKVTAGHNLVYADLVDSFGVEVARRYASSNQAAIEQIASVVDDLSIECDFERAPNFVYVETPSEGKKVEREVQAAREAGLGAELTTETELPYPVRRRSAWTARRNSIPGNTSARSRGLSTVTAAAFSNRRARPASAADRRVSSGRTRAPCRPSTSWSRRSCPSSIAGSSSRRRTR
jgi:glycine/D-amino acid oxidase-like deaminating enzyme